MTETLAHEYSSEGTQRELSNEYQHIANSVDHWGVGVSPRTDESYKGLTLTLLVAKFLNHVGSQYRMMRNTWKITETLANDYSSESA